MKSRLFGILGMIALVFSSIVAAYPVQIDIESNMVFNQEVYHCDDADCLALSFMSSSSGSNVNSYTITNPGDSGLHKYYEYDFVPGVCVVPHIYWTTTTGSTTFGPWEYFVRFGTRDDCAAPVLSLDLSDNEVNVGEEVTINAEIESVWHVPDGINPDHPIPNHLRSEYSNLVDVYLFVDDVMVDQTQVNIVWEESAPVTFTYTPSSTGLKNISVRTKVDSDCECSDSFWKRMDDVLNVIDKAECSEESDCGTDGFIGEKYCVGLDVYQDYEDFSCLFTNPYQGICSSTVNPVFLEQCAEECVDGECVDITCDTDDDCGDDGFIGDRYCFGDDVVQDFKDFVCMYPGTYNSHCTYAIYPVVLETCAYECVNGECVDPVCSEDSDCGTDGFVGEKYCIGDNLYQDYEYFQCLWAGTLYSVCDSVITFLLIEECADTCVDGECVDIICDTDNDCGDDGFIGDRYCFGDDVVQDFKDFVCMYPGTYNSQCAFTIYPVVLETCAYECVNGECIDPVCSEDSDCGTDGFVGDRFCVGDDVYQDYEDFSCLFAGTIYSACQSDISSVLIEECADTCVNGECALTAKIIADKTSGQVPLEVQFDALVNGGKAPYSYEWDFNDDGLIDSTIKSPKPTYTKKGTFTVTLKVTDYFGSTATDTIVINTRDDPSVLPRRKIFFNTIRVLNDYVRPGEELVVLVNFENDGSDKINDARVTVMVPDLALRLREGHIDLKKDEHVSKTFVLEVPEDTLPGTYDVMVVVYDDGYKRTRWREFIVI